MNRLLAVFSLLGVAAPVRGQAFSQGFDDVSALSAAGWGFVNRTPSPNPAGAWRQGSSLGTASPAFAPQAGAAGAYIRSDYTATSQTTGAVTVSDWLLTPVRTINNGDTLSFWTRTNTGGFGPERLVVRLSTNGVSANVGATADAVGDFTTTLLTINPSLQTGTAFPNDWTQYTVTVGGLGGPASGRFAFHHYVTNSGPDGINGDQLAVDTIFYNPVPEPAGLLAAAAAAGWVIRRRLRPSVAHVWPGSRPG